MSFAVFLNATRLSRVPLLATLLIVSACSNEAPKEDLRILGTPPGLAYIGVEYTYDVGVDGGEGILDFSLTNAPRWMSAEYVDNFARKGVVVHGVPGVTGGGAGASDTDDSGRTVGLSVYDGDSSASTSFVVLVSENTLSVGDLTVVEGEEGEIPKDAAGEPESCVVTQAENPLWPDPNNPDTKAPFTSIFVPVTLAQPSVRAVTVSFTTENFSDDPDSTTSAFAITRDASTGAITGDYAAHAGTVTFDPGKTLCYVRVYVYEDSLAEETENFRVKLLSVDAGLASITANGARATSIIKITDNEPLVSWELTDTVVTEGKTINVAAILDRPPLTAVTAEFELVTTGSANALVTTADNEDYSISPNPHLVVFDPNNPDPDARTRQTVTITAVDNRDNTKLADELIVLRWKTTATTRETPGQLKVYINQWRTPLPASIASLGAQAEVTEMLTDDNSSVYVAYTGYDAQTDRTFGQVNMYNRFGTAVAQTIRFAAGALNHNHRLNDIFIKSYLGAGTTEQKDRFQEIYLVGSTVGNTVRQSAGGKDILVEKWRMINDTPPYTLVWARQFGSEFDDEPKAVYVENTNNVYIVGETMGSFSGGPSKGSTDVFSLKYGPDGDLLVSRSFGTAGGDSFNDVSGTGAPQFNVAGYSEDKFAEVFIGGKDVLVASYNREGNVQRLSQTGNVEDNVGSAIASMGRALVVGGYTLGSLKQDPEVLFGGEDAFMYYMKNASVVNSSVQFGSAGNDRVSKVIADNEAAFATGYAEGPVFSDLPADQGHGGGKDAFLVRFDVEEEQLVKAWALQSGTSMDERGAGIAMTPSRKLMWLIETQTDSDTTIDIRPYNEFMESLLQ